VSEDEQISVDVKLSEPVHAYVLWIDGAGTVTPLYPWNDDKIRVDSVAARPPNVPSVERVRSPPALNKGWPADDRAGLDTILVLARRTPWPAGLNLAERMGRVPTAPVSEPGEVVIRCWINGVAQDELKVDWQRAPKKVAEKIDDQLLGVVERLKNDFEVIKALRSPHLPKR